MQKRDEFCERFPLIFAESGGAGDAPPELGHKHWLYQMLFHIAGRQYSEMQNLWGPETSASAALTFASAQMAYVQEQKMQHKRLHD